MVTWVPLEETLNTRSNRRPSPGLHLAYFADVVLLVRCDDDLF